ncbi:MAG: hypothetical protein Q8Q29_08460 [Actinomycetota bacterium]|nr:hypothetical protein [Actinomycetota bacterium]
MQHFVEEIERRGGETTITGNYGTQDLAVSDRSGELMLLRAAGWRKYGRHPARRASIAYLCGTDDNGLFAVRVPGTIETVAGALEHLEPAEVKQARKRGLRVRRQGDVYAVEVRRDRADATASSLPEAHVWNPTTRHLLHRPEDGRRHRPLRVAFPAKFVQQRTLRMGRSGRWGGAD